MMNRLPYLFRIIPASLTLSALGAILIGSAEGNPIKRDRDQFEMVYQATTPGLKKGGTLWLPLGQSDAFQTVQIRHIKSPIPWELKEDKAHGNRVLKLELPASEQEQTIEISYLVDRKEKKAYFRKEEALKKHLAPERLVPAHRTFRTLARQATRGIRGDLAKGKALYDHTLERMKYDKSGKGWGRGDALYACDARTGNCTDFHAYFIALCRAIDLPARFAIGFTIPADRDEGSIKGYHCWAEFHADGQWIPVDISEADKHPELKDYYFGHHPANRFELSMGRDLVVSPSLKSGPINFLVYPLLEVDGEIVPTSRTFSFKRLSSD